MIISHKRKFIFIHNYKVAGSSVTAALADYGLVDAPLSTKLSRAISAVVPERTYSGLKQKGLFLPFPSFAVHGRAKDVKSVIGDEIWRDYFSFGFVRNPWDWQVSLFFYMKQSKDHLQHFLIKDMSFDEYIDWRVHNEVRLQKDFFYDENGNKLVDFIGKFEDVSDDFATVCKHIGISAFLPHANKSQRDRSYIKYYNENTRNMIQDAFRDDIETFNYSF